MGQPLHGSKHAFGEYLDQVHLGDLPRALRLGKRTELTVSRLSGLGGCSMGSSAALGETAGQHRRSA